MRVVELSNHPGAMLRNIRQRQRAAADREQAGHKGAVARHRRRVQALRDQRDQARAQRRWWLWLRLALATRREARRAPQPPDIASTPTSKEESIKAGMAGEQIVAAEFGRTLDDDWTLLHGYLNNRGEIDHVLLGPRGLFAIEVKHRNATVHVNGDDWRYDKYDRYGNIVEQGQIIDGGGRSPSAQLNQSASELERFLRSRGQQVMVKRIVMLTHPRSRVGSTRNLTVDLVATSASAVLTFLNGSPPVVGAEQRARLEELIVRDHRHHEARRSAR